eukprot:c3667_g1_i1 orf=368-1753(-)
MLPLLLLLAIPFFIVVRLLCCHYIHWGKRLPPGSLGWPYLGETLQLYSQNPNVFFASKQRGYGEIFKTHILGCPCVMIASPEAVRFVLVTKAHLFKTTFPASKQGMIGSQALFFHEGDYHARLRRLVQSVFMPDAIRRLVADIESLSLRTLSSWQGRTINTLSEMKRYALDVSMLVIFGRQNQLNTEELKETYATLEQGYNSMPVNLPGTKFRKSMKARNHLNKLLRSCISERRKNNMEENDLLGTLMKFKDENGIGLSDQQITDNIIGVIFAARDTTASALTWIVKFLKESPALLESVIAEQEGIRQGKKVDAAGLTWTDTKNMRLTSRVIQETLRMATILSFTFREALVDIEYKGYIIPKGWKVMPLFRNIHHSPEFFPEPQKFDPSRFEVPVKPNTFLPFGNGLHSCPGSELAKLEMLILIHHLTTNFRWEVGQTKSGIQYDPFPVPKEGLPIIFNRK